MIKEMKKLGRPRTDDSEKLKLRQVRIKDREYDVIVRAAESAGVSFSEFMRDAGLVAAGKVLS